MYAFIKATTWHHSAFLRAENGDVWRVWFGTDNQPLIERLTPSQYVDYFVPIQETSIDIK